MHGPLTCTKQYCYPHSKIHVQMPIMDGLEATRRIRQREVTRGLIRTPIIALSASTDSGAQEEAVAAGMDDWYEMNF